MESAPTTIKTDVISEQKHRDTSNELPDRRLSPNPGGPVNSLAAGIPSQHPRRLTLFLPRTNNFFGPDQDTGSGHFFTRKPLW